MSKTQEERVEHALSQLLERILPTYPDEDEAAADERFEDAFNLAIEAIGRQGPERLIRDNSSPDKALKFSNLFSKLLAQPVLNQKWAMLHFLHLLSDSEPPTTTPNNGTLIRPVTETTGERQFLVDSPAFNEAFSSAGLRRLPKPETAKPARPVQTPRAERRPERRKVDAAEEQDPVPAPSPDNARTTGQEPSEPALLRDLPFTLQGLSSTNLVFSAPNKLKLPATLPVPLISLLHSLAEPSLLYRSLSEFVESSEGGLVGQSFRSALGAELRSYLGLVATLEGQIRRALAQLDESLPRQGIGKAGVTLRRCVVWTREATMGLRLMSLMVEESRGKKGGELISLIHSFSLSHGDPFVGAFAERLLSHVTRPFYDMLRQWVYDGELSDPYLEFFVCEQKQLPEKDEDGNEKGGATSVWEDKYKLNPPMVPSIITEDFANKVFLIGKTLNFIRHGCGDAAWVESYSKSASRELRYGDTASLERSIGLAYKTTMARLIELMETRFQLFEHLRAMKSYILLGAGDFIAVLMESLSSALDRPAITQYRHTLTAQLEHAVRNSNAQYDLPDVLRRLDARMLELTHGDIGWDVFTLEYRIDAPVDVIVTPFAGKQYLKVFNFLWRVKRIEFALGSTWRRCMTGARGVLGAVSDKVGADWKKARAVVAEMIHFVNQLQYYILFEVVEASWTELQRKMRREGCTLDDLIQAHSKYLEDITRKGLLGSTVVDFPAQLHELLKLMLLYRDAVDGLYSFSVAEFSRRQDKAAVIEARTKAGKWGVSERQMDTGSPFAAAPASKLVGGSANDDDILAGLRVRLGNLSEDFRRRVNVLLGDLYYQPDPDLRWLAMVMNFNDVYEPVRRRRGGSRKDKEKEKEKGRGKEAEVKDGGEGGREAGEKAKA
ncbi:Microtubule-nucleating Tub4p (gamma-tubulin) complex component [Coniosporium tulheliwenetii]|uniref:Microtubule-nucleating Tub4p (Gamma-tubulin) complex component n=1 Tax=Coniosporium tulheliwenetii TaxID=3383036 RepID=A0ACC2Z736_9PEZI|nr:Microtubule-nucleating Tub4p (gamma-tubulin) complex component [Cladosporium sp. JES 115]